MIGKKILLSLVGLCFVSGLIFGLYKTGAMANVSKVAMQNQDVSTLAPDQVHDQSFAEKSQSTDNNLGAVPISLPDTKDEQIPSVEPDNTTNEDIKRENDDLDKLIADGTIIDAKKGEVYTTKKVIAVDKSVIFCVEGNRTADPDILLPSGRYYAVIDFSIANLQDKPYLSSLTNFVLEDSRGYTFVPVSTERTIGNISGEILSGIDNMKRGEIAFAVPNTEQSFVLRVKTGLDVQSINFTINAISPNLAWPKPYN